MTMFQAGRFEKAIALIKKAMRLSPYYPTWYLFYLAESYRMAGRYEEAIATYNNKENLSRTRNPFLYHVGLVEVYMELGREEKARAHAAEVLRLNPDFSLEYVRNFNFFKDPAHLERRLEALRKAGLK